MRAYTIQTVTAPASEPVTASDAQSHLDITGETSLLEALITAARQAAESYTRRAFITQTLRLQLDRFPTKDGLGWWDGVREGALTMQQSKILELPRPPLKSVGGVTYYDTDDDSNTFADSNYLVVTKREPGVIQLKHGKTWPADVRDLSAVEVEYDAGYGSASDVPQAIRRAILMEVANLYERRDAGIQQQRVGEVSVTYATGSELSPMSRRLLEPHRVLRV